MILGFKRQFVGKIRRGEKIHTIREDKHGRWIPGRKIHFATGVRTKNYIQFDAGECKSIQEIKIQDFKIFVDGKELDPKQNIKLSKNDGFDHIAHFFNWFGPHFQGKIIHWTDYKY